MKNSHYDNLYKNEVGHWWYRVRRGIIASLFNKYANRGNLKILDVGCGTGALLKELRQYGDVYGLDSSEKAINFCKSRGEENLTLGSINRIPFQDNFFDVVVSLDVLEHVSDDVGAILEIKRVLKSGGVSIVFVPVFMLLWGRTDELSCHLRRYRLVDLKRKISGAGLNIIRSTYFNFFLFLPILIVRTALRLLGIKVNNKNDIGPQFINRILFIIIYIEAQLLEYISFPFGVSAMVISKKP